MHTFGGEDTPMNTNVNGYGSRLTQQQVFLYHTEHHYHVTSV